MGAPGAPCEEPADGFPLLPADEVLIRKKKRTHSKLKKRLKIAGIVAGAIVLVVGGASWAVVGSVKAGEAARMRTTRTSCPW